MWNFSWISSRKIEVACFFRCHSQFSVHRHSITKRRTSSSSIEQPKHTNIVHEFQKVIRCLPSNRLIRPKLLARASFHSKPNTGARTIKTHTHTHKKASTWTIELQCSTCWAIVLVRACSFFVFYSNRLIIFDAKRCGGMAITATVSLQWKQMNGSIFLVQPKNFVAVNSLVLGESLNSLV